MRGIRAVQNEERDDEGRQKIVVTTSDGRQLDGNVSGPLGAMTVMVHIGDPRTGWLRCRLRSTVGVGVWRTVLYAQPVYGEQRLTREGVAA